MPLLKDSLLGVRTATLAWLSQGLGQDVGQISIALSVKSAMPAEFINALLDMVQNSQEILGLRHQAIDTLGKLQDFATLRTVVLDRNLSANLRLRAIKYLGKTGEQASAVLLPLVQNQGADFAELAGQAMPSLYLALANSSKRDAAVIKTLAQHLRELTKAKTRWRNARDNDEENTADKRPDCERSSDEYDAKQYWKREVEERQLGYALMRLTPESDEQFLLEHPLLEVRRGAYHALAQHADPKLLHKLDGMRRVSQGPIFRHAAYRAIDWGLRYIEVSDKREDLEVLQTWLEETEDAAIRGRLEWTLGWGAYRVENK